MNKLYNITDIFHIYYVDVDSQYKKYKIKTLSKEWRKIVYKNLKHIIKNSIKKIILLALTALMVVGCKSSVEEDTKDCKEYYHVIILDSCEYYSLTYRHDITHKGNCRFCAERRKQELKELVEQLKEK